MYTVNPFIHTKTKKVKKTVLNILKFKTIIFKYIYNFQEQNFLIN